jgi:hypothetical protein
MNTPQPIVRKIINENPLDQILAEGEEALVKEYINVWDIHISARRSVLEVYYEINLETPSMVVRQGVEDKYIRFDSDTNQAFDGFRTSAIGRAITLAISETLKNYPNLQQSE